MNEMTDEEYLRACGWKLDAHGGWYRRDDEPTCNLGGAVERQLAEDRARDNFMRARSGILNGELVHPDEALR